MLIDLSLLMFVIAKSPLGNTVVLNIIPSLLPSSLQHQGLASDIVRARQLHPELGREEHLVHLHVQSLP